MADLPVRAERLLDLLDERRVQYPAPSLEPGCPCQLHRDLREQRRTGRLHHEDNAAVRFPEAAVDRYSQSQVDAYGAGHDLGPDPYEGLPDDGSSPDYGGENGGSAGDCQGYDPCIQPGDDQTRGRRYARALASAPFCERIAATASIRPYRRCTTK